MVWPVLALFMGCSAPQAPAPEVRSPVRQLAPSLGNPPPLPPSEHWVHQDAEMTNKARRKQWFRERHRAPPYVDYKAVERVNGLAAIARRNALAGREPIDDFGAAWVERGSENQAGRMMVAALSADGQSLYAGSSLGGVWRGTLQGDGWEPLGDNLYGGAHWLVLFPPDTPGGPEVMLAATDDGLVHRSPDDGATWTVPSGIGSIWSVKRLAKLQDGSHTAFAVVREAGSDAHRVIRSTDSGASWSTVLDLGDVAGDVWVPRDGGTELFAAGDGSIHHSADLGDTWTPTGNLPATADRVELAGSEAGAPTLYAVTTLDGMAQMWRTDDRAQSWSELGRDIEDYWGVLTASAVDPALVVWGGVEVHRSADSGQTFDVVNGWFEYYDDPVNKLHADIMGIDLIVDSGGSETWYVGTDGGLFESTDGLVSVENLSLRGLRVSQYYATLSDATDPTRIAAGSQDQGYQITNGIAQSGDQWDFDQILSGDYAHLTSSDGSHDWVYSVYPDFMLVQQGGEEPVLHYVGFPPDPRFSWLPRLVADPKRSSSVFIAGSRLHRASFEDPYFEWEEWSDQNFSGDGYEYLSGLAFAPTDTDRAYAVTSYGRLFTSDDRGRTWEAEEAEGPSGHYFYGTALRVKSDDPDIAWVGGSGYGGPAIYRTRNGGRTWVPFDDGLPDTLVYSLCEAADGSGVLFAGTHTGAWRRDPGTDNEWVEITGIDAPTTIYWSCEALQTENTIRWGTYGRGIWDYQLDPEGLGCFPPVDRDGDGVDCDTDCDDADPDVFPGNTDGPCDGRDHDCDPRNDAPDEVCAEQSTGCGCATGVPPTAWWVLALGPLARRRERRSVG